jgi:predicted nucleic acid-binding protein
LIISSYVLLESYALLGRRRGLAAVARFRADFAPLLDVLWVDAALHERGLDLLLERNSGSFSLVDAVSFLVMRDERLDEAFAYDRHFDDEGLKTI